MALTLNKYWGEIEEEHDSQSNIVPDVMVDIERAMNKFCLAEYDVDYDEDPSLEEHVILEPMDPLILYAISLHKYSNDMNDIILDGKAIASPLMPEMPKIRKNHNKNSLNFISKEFSPFSVGEKVDVPEISSTIARDILSKCVATMFAHIGFETTHQSVLDLLTDVLIDFLKKITYALKVAAEDEENGQLCGFPNISERVLVELGLGGAKGLHDYYQTRVVKYIMTLQQRCNKLREMYESLVINKHSPSDLKEISIKREKVDDDEEVIEVDNPQVHLPIEGEVGFSSLEAGYQLLSSLEAGTNPQNLVEHEDETSITISPGVMSISDTELPAMLSPFTKKKRTK